MTTRARARFLCLFVALAAVPGLAGAASPAPAALFELDPDHSEVAFRVRHMMMSHVRGAFRQAQGTVVWDEANVHKSRVEVTLAASSIDTGTAKRDDHLRSADFLDAPAFPSIAFKSTKVTRAGRGLVVVGELTIKGVTRPLTLTVSELTKPVKDPFGQVRAGAHASGKISRKDFGLAWNKALETGGVLVGDDVAIEIDAELVKKEAAPPRVPTSAP